MDFQSLIETKLEPVGQSNNDIIYRCPQCEGSTGSGHLYVNYDRGYYNCFKCTLGGRRLEGLLKILHIDIQYDYIKLYSEHDTELDKIISNKSKKIITPKVVEYSTDLKVLTEYYDWHTQTISLRAYDYLRSRGITDSIINRLKIREGINRYSEQIEINSTSYSGRDYSGRIMVPSLRRDGLISFYVGRDYIGDKPAKYLNPPKELSAASEDVWNLDMVNSDSVIICEGVFTAIFASPYKLNSVATYGKSISAIANNRDVRVTSQGEKLLAKKFKNYFIAYDADAYKEAINSCKYLYDRGANVYLVLIDPIKYGAHADVADIGFNEFSKLLSTAIHYQGEISSLTLED